MNNEYNEAKQRLEQAEQNFNYADQNHIDAAVFELMAAEEKWDAIRREH